MRTRAPGEKGGITSSPRNSRPWRNVGPAIRTVSPPWAPAPAPAVFCVPSAPDLFPTRISLADPMGSEIAPLLTPSKILSPGDHPVLLSFLAGRHPNAQGRLGAGNSDKRLLSKVLRMAILRQHSTEFSRNFFFFFFKRGAGVEGGAEGEGERPS